jgi:hypothetical protein
MTAAQQPTHDVADQEAEIDWGTAPPGPPEANRVREHIIVEIRPGLLRITGAHPQSIVAIHSRQSLSNDVQKTTLYLLTALFVTIGAYIIVFGPQDKYNTVIVGIFLLVIAAGTFGFTTLSFSGFGVTGTAAGQPQPRPTSSVGAKVVLLMIGVVIGAIAVYGLTAFNLIPVPPL